MRIQSGDYHARAKEAMRTYQEEPRGLFTGHLLDAQVGTADILTLQIERLLVSGSDFHAGQARRERSKLPGRSRPRPFPDAVIGGQRLRSSAGRSKVARVVDDGRVAGAHVRLHRSGVRRVRGSIHALALGRTHPAEGGVEARRGRGSVV